MGALIPQTSFAAGELAPTLYGQFQNAAYAHGLRGCRNFFISPHGAAVSRPGTEHVLTINNVFVGGSTPTRLIPFRYADDLSFMLAFSDTDYGATAHVIRDGAEVHSLVSPFHRAGGLDLRKIRASQVGANLYLTHPEIAPQVLTYGGTDTAWVFTAADFDPPGITGADPLLVLPGPTGPNVKEWEWAVTQIIEYPTGLKLETKMARLTKGNEFAAGYHPVGLSANKNRYELKAEDGGYFEIDMTVRGLVVYPGYQVLSWRVYRGRGGKAMGFVDEIDWSWSTDPASNRYLDWGKEPDYTVAPPQGTNPFKVYSTDGLATLVRTESPSACGFYDGRLVLAGTTQRPFTIWLSAADNYLDFDERFSPVPDGSVEITLAARQWEEIRSVLSLNQLLVFTDTSVWAVAGAGGAPIAGDDQAQARVQSEVGASWRSPLVVGSSVLYVAARGGHVYDLAFTTEGGGYAGGDLSHLARHLFRQEIVGWTHARQPWNLVWAALDDGTAVSLQYRSGQVPGWSRHTTDGTFEDFCSIPEGDEDAVYVATKRGAYRFVERMTTRVIDDVADAVCVDNAATYEGVATTTPAVWSHLAGKTVYGLADGFVVGPLVVSGGGGVTLGLAAEKVTLGLRYTPELETLDLAAGRNREKNVKRVFVDVEASRGLYVGEDFDHLAPWKQRSQTDAFDATPLSSETVEVRIGSTWNRGGRAVLRQVDPTPVTVTAFTREVEAGGT